MGLRDRGGARNADLTAQVKKIVLHAEQGGANLVRTGFGKDDADAGVEFVDFTDGFDA